jgi:phosphohistidine phosphatase SixA
MKVPPRLQSIAILSLLGLGSALAQSLSGETVAALRAGGYVLVMRHAHSPREVPDAASAHRDNIELERQLDADGRAAAAKMGIAVRDLGIPIGEILTSPTFRALETVHALSLGDAQSVEELGDGGRNMQPDAEGRRSAWLRAKAAESPSETKNRLLVTHLPNLRGAFGDAAADMADGETLILRPAQDGAVVVGRVRIDQWSSLNGD